MMIDMKLYGVIYFDAKGKQIKRTVIAAETNAHARAIGLVDSPAEAARCQLYQIIKLKVMECSEIVRDDVGEVDVMDSLRARVDELNKSGMFEDVTEEEAEAPAFLASIPHLVNGTGNGSGDPKTAKHKAA